MTTNAELNKKVNKLNKIIKRMLLEISLYGKISMQYAEELFDEL